MKEFEAFKIENQELIFGGELVATFVDCPHSGQEDLYDTERKRTIIFN